MVKSTQYFKTEIKVIRMLPNNTMSLSHYIYVYYSSLLRYYYIFLILHGSIYRFEYLKKLLKLKFIYITI